MQSSPVIVVVAMADEAAPFLELASWVGDEVVVGTAVLREIEVSGQRLQLVQSGIGFVNAAAAATAAILRAREATPAGPPLLVSAGTAGGLGDGVAVGDVVVGSEYINIDADARVFGYVLGQVPGMPAVYEGDPRMLAAVPELARAGAVRTGLIASSYSFVTAERAAIARADFPRVAAVDMESSALAQVCFSQHVPFVSVRGISDLASATAATDFVENTDRTALRSADVALTLAALAEAAAASPTADTTTAPASTPTP
ncbi:MAG: 5'-methylthioadenosine/S-adenosylhomocysteine nucleosidase [Herbiconiux sp.]|nr:5'-methylthioadenosine/S-adenosylhomocysteine nucleosidase [Herbiconiux sp.]